MKKAPERSGAFIHFGAAARRLALVCNILLLAPFMPEAGAALPNVSDILAARWRRCGPSHLPFHERAQQDKISLDQPRIVVLIYTPKRSDLSHEGRKT